MSNDVRSFIEAAITEGGEIKLGRVMNVKEQNSVFMLVKTDCIEIRTREQHEALLNKLSKLIQLTNDERYKKLYNKIFSYSKILSINGIGEIRLGKNLTSTRGFGKRIVIEKCDGCIKLWHPNMFKEELDASKAAALHR